MGAGPGPGPSVACRGGVKAGMGPPTSSPAVVPRSLKRPRHLHTDDGLRDPGAPRACVAPRVVVEAALPLTSAPGAAGTPPATQRTAPCVGP